MHLTQQKKSVCKSYFLSSICQPTTHDQVHFIKFYKLYARTWQKNAVLLCRKTSTNKSHAANDMKSRILGGDTFFLQSSAVTEIGIEFRFLSIKPEKKCRTSTIWDDLKRFGSTTHAYHAFPRRRYLFPSIEHHCLFRQHFCSALPLFRRKQQKSGCRPFLRLLDQRTMFFLPTAKPKPS